MHFEPAGLPIIDGSEAVHLLSLKSLTGVGFLCGWKLDVPYADLMSPREQMSLCFQSVVSLWMVSPGCSGPCRGRGSLWGWGEGVAHDAICVGTDGGLGKSFWQEWLLHLIKA